MHIDFQENSVSEKHMNTSDLTSLLQLNSDVHSRNTRFSKLNHCTEEGRTFSVRSIKDWNNLEKALKNSKDKKSFKKTLINTLLERQKESNIFGTPF